MVEEVREALGRNVQQRRGEGATTPRTCAGDACSSSLRKYFSASQARSVRPWGRAQRDGAGRGKWGGAGKGNGSQLSALLQRYDFSQ